MHIHLFLNPVTEAGINIPQYETWCQMSLHFSETLSEIEGGVTESLGTVDSYIQNSRVLQKWFKKGAMTLPEQE